MSSTENNNLDAKSKEAAEEYRSSLADLTINSKPLINMLTILAEENIRHAPAIVQTIETHLQKVRSEIKLPILYLIDSIVKNVTKDYLHLFNHNIVNTFCGVFQQVDENTRASMWKLRQTWNDVFKPNKLYALDVRVQSIDPAWPITSHPPQSKNQALKAPTLPTHQVHINPKFFSTEPDAQKKLMIMERQKELLELQKQKIDLELKAAKASLQQQQSDENAAKMAIDRLAPEFGAAPSQKRKSLEKQFPTAAASLLKSDSKSPSGIRIAPASSIAVASAKPVAPSRDPRLKASDQQPASVNKSQADLQQQILKHINLHLQSNKVSSEPTAVIDKSSNSVKTNSSTKQQQPQQQQPENSLINSSSNNKKAISKDNAQTINSNSTTKTTRDPTSSNSPRSSDNNPSINNNSSNQQQKSSSTSSSNSSNSTNTSNSSSSSQSSKKDRSSSSSSSRKVGGKSRSRDQSSSSPKVPKIEKKSESSTSLKSNKSTSSSSSSESKSKKSRKRSPSPVVPYRIPRRSKSSQLPQQGLDEEEQSGSLIVSPPHPPTFKELKSSTKQRNYVRRNKGGSKSPEIEAAVEVKKEPVETAQDEDLRTPIITVTASNVPLDSITKDLDLRILPGKRQPPDVSESSQVKKSKTAERFDALFGSEDVDLRTLTNPKAGRPPTPPPPMISDGDGKASWAKIKTPSGKSDRASADTNGKVSEKSSSGRDRLGRPRLHSRSSEDTSKESSEHRTRNRRGPLRDLDKNERNADRNIEIIMKQAAEQLDQGMISRAQYNKLIQDVLHMSEDQKLRAAQRKEKEAMMIWENSHHQKYDENMRTKEMRDQRGPGGPGGQNGSRWNGPWHGLWPPPPPPPHGRPPFFGPPMGPWQRPPHFSVLRPPDFHFHAFGPRMPPMIPMGPLPMPRGPPMGSMANGMINQQHQQQEKMEEDGASNSMSSGGLGELPSANSEMLKEIMKDSMKSINIDGVPREIRYYGDRGIVFMSWDDPRDIGFQDGQRRILIDDKDTVLCNFNEDYKEFLYEGDVHRIKLGGPSRELYIDGKYYECYFGGKAINLNLGSKAVTIKLEGPAPQVKIGNKRTDLVIGKINLIVNARNMVPVFLDSKPQMFEVDGQQFTLEFIDSLKRVLLNGAPFDVEFGGLPKPIYFNGKKHFIRFTVLPKGFRAGCVRITGMKGEQPLETTNIFEQQGQSLNDPLASTTPSVSEVSQDGMDVNSNPNLQLDVLSSVMPSAMAPASGLSYQAETIVNVQAPVIDMDLNTLFQRLVETGIVPLATEPKKSEEKTVQEVLPVSFTEPETLKVKQPVIVANLYSGMQCSSCGARFAPELATKYSHHLDWHFRQNRRERDSAKKAHSRPWYYEISDWTQFEEIEDLDERAQSWFETEKQSAEIDNAAVEDDSQETVQPSVTASSEEEDSKCCVCQDAFEQYYHEDKEEWCFRPAVSFENKNYHPLCLDDHKKALEKSAKVLEEKLAEITEKIINPPKEVVKVPEVEKMEVEPEPETKPELEEKLEVNPIEDTQLPGEAVVEPKTEPEILDDSFDDQIQVIETVSTKKIEIVEEIVGDSDDEEEGTRELVKRQQESDVPFDFESVKIKEEPLDDSEDLEILEPETRVIEPAAVDTTQVAVKTAIDGNVENESAAPTIPTIPSRIKINITKPLVSQPKEHLEESTEKVKALDDDIDIVEAPPHLVPASIKPALQGRKLAILPVVEKGEELSGLCSIM